MYPVYICTYGFNRKVTRYDHYLSKATTATSAALPNPTSVLDVLVFTWVRLQQTQEQLYPVLSVHVTFQCLPPGKATAFHGLYTSNGNDVLLQDTTHLIHRPCYQRGSPCQDPAGNRTTRRPDVVKRRKLQWYGHVSHSSGLAKNILQGTVKGGRKQGRQKKEVGRQPQRMDRPGVLEVPGDSGEQRKMEATGCESSVGPQRPSRLRDR